MPRFQSKLFNWIDRSLPVQLGRRVRRSLDLALSGAPWDRLPKRIALEAARVLMEPLFALSASVHRSYPAIAAAEASESSDLGASLSEPNWDEDLDPEFASFERSGRSELIAFPPQPNPKELQGKRSATVLPSQKIPLLLRPFRSFLVWIDRTKQALDRQIQATNAANPSPAPVNETVLANRIFYEVWQQRKLGGEAVSDSLGANAKLEQVRALIRAAIAYFFGQSPHIPPLDSSIPTTIETTVEPWLTMVEVFGDESEHWPPFATLSSEAPAPEIDPLHRSGDIFTSEFVKLEEGAIAQRSFAGSLTKFENGAIIYLATTGELVQLQDNQMIHLAATGELIRITGRSIIHLGTTGGLKQLEADTLLCLAPGGELVQVEVGAIARLDRTGELVKLEVGTIARLAPSGELIKLEDGTIARLTETEITGTMATQPSAQLANRSATMISSSPRGGDRALAVIYAETTTTELDRVRAGSLTTDWHDQLREIEESPSRIRAWIETNATFLGYAYSPVMTAIHWLDALVAKIERWLLKFWQGLWQGLWQGKRKKEKGKK